MRKGNLIARPSHIRAYQGFLDPDPVTCDAGLEYIGIEDGIAIWTCPIPVTTTEVRVGMLPPKTSVRFFPGLPDGGVPA